MTGELENILFALLGMALFAAGVWVLLVVNPKTRRRLARAVPAEGVIERFLWGGTMPVVRYRDISGLEHTASPSFGAPQRDGEPPSPSLAAGEVVKLRYDPEDPRWIALDALGEPLRAYRLLAFVLIVMGAGTTWMSLA